VFCNIREAFLPPVTIEELDALVENSTERTSFDDRREARVPGTRGWYDNAFERVNFIVPVLVTLMFVAIQVIVFRTHLKS